MRVLYIVRGLPGSGKSTLAKKLVDKDRHVEADTYHMKNGLYCYDSSKASEAHSWCQNRVDQLTGSSREDCAVSNTFTTISEMIPYMITAEENLFSCQIIECHGPWKSIHGVPEEVIQKMKNRWESWRPDYER